MPHEFERIVEFSYHTKNQKFVVRFLDGKSYTFTIFDLPKKMQTKKPNWEESYLSGDGTSIVVHAGKEVREIASHIIHSKGKEV